jgi:hypothetical protein
MQSPPEASDRGSGDALMSPIRRALEVVFDLLGESVSPGSREHVKDFEEFTRPEDVSVQILLVHR